MMQVKFKTTYIHTHNHAFQLQFTKQNSVYVCVWITYTVYCIRTYWAKHNIYVSNSHQNISASSWPWSSSCSYVIALTHSRSVYAASRIRRISRVTRARAHYYKFTNQSPSARTQHTCGLHITSVHKQTSPPRALGGLGGGATICEYWANVDMTTKMRGIDLKRMRPNFKHSLTLRLISSVSVGHALFSLLFVFALLFKQQTTIGLALLRRLTMHLLDTIASRFWPPFRARRSGYAPHVGGHGAPIAPFSPAEIVVVSRHYCPEAIERDLYAPSPQYTSILERNTHFSTPNGKTF